MAKENDNVNKDVANSLSEYSDIANKSINVGLNTVNEINRWYEQQLNKMTEILFSGSELNCPEDFLNIYIKLAALENRVEAFLFGNIQKAYLFLDENRKNEARQIVNDLVEMGAGESEDVVALKEMLN